MKNSVFSSSDNREEASNSCIMSEYSPENQSSKEYKHQLGERKKKFGRLPLFIVDKTKLYDFMELLAASESNNDVVRAVKRINGGKVPTDYREKDFLQAVMPYLLYRTTFHSLYTAFNRA